MLMRTTLTHFDLSTLAVRIKPSITSYVSSMFIKKNDTINMDTSQIATVLNENTHSLIIYCCSKNKIWKTNGTIYRL